VAYPEPIPELNEKEFEEFLERLSNFSLTQEQREFWHEAMRRYRRENDGRRK